METEESVKPFSMSFNNERHSAILTKLIIKKLCNLIMFHLSRSSYSSNHLFKLSAPLSDTFIQYLLGSWDENLRNWGNLFTVENVHGT